MQSKEERQSLLRVEQRVETATEEDEEVYEPQPAESSHVSPQVLPLPPPSTHVTRAKASASTKKDGKRGNKQVAPPGAEANASTPTTTAADGLLTPESDEVETQRPRARSHSHMMRDDEEVEQQTSKKGKKKAKATKKTTKSGDQDTPMNEETPVKGTRFRRILEEFKAIMWLAVPISTSFFLDNAMGTITLLFMGHMGARELAAGSLGLTLTNTTGMSVGNGLLLALDTQAAHVWGMGKRKRLGVITQRAILVILAYCIPISALWLFADKILILLGQDPEISRMTRTFVLWMIPGLFPAMLYEALRRHLQAMNIVMPITVIVLLSIPIETAFLFVCLDVFELGIAGCAIAVSLIYIVQAILLLAYVIGRRHVLAVSWPGFTRKAFHGWWRFLKLAIPSALMSCMEGWGFDVMSLFAGWIGTVPLAAHSALINTYYIAYMIPLGIGCASTTRVGTLLGARKPASARLSYYISLVMCIFFELLVSLVLVAGRTWVAKMFCSDINVISTYVQLIPIVCLVMLVDGGQIAGSGGLRGLGKQRFGMICNFIAFYVIGLPLGYVLTFVAKLGLIGIWLGIGACDAISAVAFTVVLVCSNWKKAAIEISQEAETAKIAEKERNIQGDEGVASVSETAAVVVATVAREKDTGEGEETPTERSALTPKVHDSPLPHTPTPPTYGTYAAVDSETEARRVATVAVVVEGDDVAEATASTMRHRGDDDDDDDGGGGAATSSSASAMPATTSGGSSTTTTGAAVLSGPPQQGGDTESDDSAATSGKEKKKSVIRIQEPPSPKLDPDYV